MPNADPPRRVTVISLGGTIAMTTAPTGGVIPALSADDLLAAVPGLADSGIDVQTHDLRQLPGASLSFDDLTDLLHAINRQWASGAHGVVVVQGTDTIEETAYHLDLHHGGPQPVVVTGAMRNPTQAGADGPANLLAAIAAAADPACRDLGVLVVLADEIHAARRVRKTHTTAGATFQSTNGGPLGYLVECQPIILNRGLARTVVPVSLDRSPMVTLLTVTLGDDPTLLDILAGRIDGLVIAGFGAGHVPAAFVAPLTELAARKPVVLASRTGAGSVLSDTYGFAGSERDLIGRGLMAAGFLDPYKARILLRALLAAQADDTTIRAAFRAAGSWHPAGWPWPTSVDREGPTDA